MSCKHPLLGKNAVGYWGRNPRKAFDALDSPDRVIALHIDKLRLMGLPYAVWREASAVLTNPTLCSCFKDTSKQPDINCLSCYGSGYLPGYLKFGTTNWWFASTDPSWVLTNVVLDTTNRPYRLHLEPTATTGTAMTPDLAISMATKKGPWQSAFAGFTRDNGVNSSILVQFSVDFGATWDTLSATNLEIAGSFTQIRFRVTFNRLNVNVKSPMFEIVRIRFPTIGDEISGSPIQEPVIRMLPSWDTQQEVRQPFGTKIDASGRRMWTIPLNFFDSSILPNTPQARLFDDVILECRFGAEIGFRYGVNQFRYSDQFGVFTRQEFEVRRYAGSPGKIDGEFAYRIF